MQLGTAGLNQEPTSCRAVRHEKVNEYKVGIGREKEAELFVGWWERKIWKGEGGEEQTDMTELLATQVQGDVHIWTIAKGLV